MTNPSSTFPGNRGLFAKLLFLVLILSWFIFYDESLFLLVTAIVPSKQENGRSNFKYVSNNDKEDDDNLIGSKSNPVLRVAPLIVSAICKDGIAMIAVHNDHDYKQREDTPPRIKLIDNYGTTLMCSGWRPDAEWLASTCRIMTADETYNFGISSPDILARDVSLWMAQREVFYGRAPCVVGLLGATSSSNFIKDSSRLWLIDATGAYRVRAHAIGKDDEIINSRLLEIDFTKLSSEEGLDCIRTIILSHYIDTSNDTEATKENIYGGECEALSENTPIETAIIDSRLNQLIAQTIQPLSSRKTKNASTDYE